uniref:Growth/differentiation factor 6 n=1 Tax=Wuchereria bancrofti TaxID=6293 RepID=A0AAF5RVJ1_WUCBA
MNEFLESIKPEILVEQRTKVHNQLITTPTSATLIVTTAITTNFTTASEITVEKTRQKRNYHSYRTQQVASLKILESVIFPLIIIFYSSASSLSTASTDLPSIGTSRFTEQEIQLLREAFLRKFGMKEQPKQAKPAVSVPYYMWNIYEKVKMEDIAWVRHYYPYNVMESDNSTLLLQYDLSVTVRNITSEIINRAELKLKLRNEKNRRHIKIYEVDQRNPEIWRLIDAKFIEGDLREEYQWMEMDVTEAIRRKRPNMNRVDFAMKLLSKYASTSYQLAAYSVSPCDRKQSSALVVYVQTDDTARVRKKRKANKRRRHQHKKHDHRSADNNYCRRTQLLVDFNELNWQDWILAPSSYSAYQCQGECPNPLTSHFNTTNHAIVQGLINSVDPNIVPAPCCVPTEMESLAILYIDVEGKIVIKNYPDMEVLSCGCR